MLSIERFAVILEEGTHISVTRHVPALIVGGGISGLVCAYALRKAGIETLVLENSQRPGGVIHSITRGGFLLECGPQSFTGTSALRQLCEELGIAGQLLDAPPRAPRYVLIDGSLCPVPLNALAFFTTALINGSTKLALLRDIFGKSVPPASDESIAAFVRRKFSAQVLDRLVGPFVSGIYAGDPERLSMRSAFPQLHDAEKATGSIVRGMLRLAKTKKGPRKRPQLQTFREGNETLVRALVKQIGPTLCLQVSVAEISRQNDRSFIVRVENNGREESLSADTLIFATPTAVTGNLLRQLDSSFEALLTPVEYAAVAVVSLGYRKTDVGNALEGFGFLVPRSAGLRVLGTVWNSSLFPDRAPEGHALLTSFVGGSTDPSAAKLSPQELANLVHRELSPLLSIKNHPVFSNATIWPRALPQYNLGHGDRLATIAKLLARFPGIWLAGNYLRGPAIGSCIDQSLAVAEEVKTALAH